MLFNRYFFYFFKFFWKEGGIDGNEAGEFPFLRLGRMILNPVAEMGEIVLMKKQ